MGRTGRIAVRIMGLALAAGVLLALLGLNAGLADAVQRLPGVGPVLAAMMAR